MEPAKPSAKLNLRVGQWVEVRSAREILATLDKNGCLEGLPFMPEMLRFCGRTYSVRKRITKIIDIVKMTGLRKMTSTVSLEGIRCDGSGHGGCQAGCHLLWKEAWLRKGGRKRADGLADVGKMTADVSRQQAKAAETDLYRVTCRYQHENAEREYYRCQATQLFDASDYLSWWNPGQYLVDLWSGNVSLWEFARVTLIALFNFVQTLRGGIMYPHLEPLDQERSPSEELNLMPGELVQVKSKEEIRKTLDRNFRNRGLWFDKEMLRYCGGQFRVLRRVERTIKEKTGKLLKLRNPCVILDGVTATGDLYRFNPQNEYIFWREIWLKRVSRERKTFFDQGDSAA